MNWTHRHHSLSMSLAILVGSLFITTGVMWAVLIFIGGRRLADEIMASNAIRTFLVVAIVFLAWIIR